MEESTTSENGGAEAPQPNTNTEAVSLGEQGAPTLRPSTAPTSTPQSQTQTTEEEAADAGTTESNDEVAQPATAQAETEEFDAQAFAKKKGIDLKKIDPESLLKMQYEAEQKMHEATARAREVETAMSQNPNLEYTGDPNYDALARDMNEIKIDRRVEAFFRSNPEAREHEQKMAEIVMQRPYLQNDMEALYALAVNSPDRQAQLKQAGGREALTNLAQKQSAVPPQSNASSGVTSSQEKITPDNVDQIVASHMGDAKWWSAHQAEVNRAMAGNR